MKRKSSLTKAAAVVSTGFMLFSTVGAVSVRAEERSTKTYTVTFRPGNVGRFSPGETGDTEKKTKKEDAEEVARLLYDGIDGITDIRATENGAIRLTVEKGAAVPDAPETAYVQADSGYFVKNVSEWGPQDGDIVTKNMDFVVDYGRLAEGVEYTVQSAKAVESGAGGTTFRVKTMRQNTAVYAAVGIAAAGLAAALAVWIQIKKVRTSTEE